MKDQIIAMITRDIELSRSGKDIKFRHRVLKIMGIQSDLNVKKRYNNLLTSYERNPNLTNKMIACGIYRYLESKRRSCK